MSKDFIVLMIIIAAGALLGAVIGEAIGAAVRHDSLIYQMFVKGVSVGLQPPVTLSLVILTLTFGFTLKLNLSAVVGIVLALVLFRKLT